MSTQDNNGAAPAFACANNACYAPGLDKREYFAVHADPDPRLIKAIRAMDDSALLLFGMHPDLENEDWVAQVEPVEWSAMGSELEKVVKRLELEAKAIARARTMHADALLEALANPAPSEPPAPQEGTGADLSDHCYACEKPCVYSDIPDPTNGAARCVDCLVKIQANHIKNLEGAASPSPTEGEALGLLREIACLLRVGYEEKNTELFDEWDSSMKKLLSAADTVLSQSKGGQSNV